MVAAGFSLRKILVGARLAEPRELRNVRATLAVAHLRARRAVPLQKNHFGQGQALPLLFKSLGTTCRAPTLRF